MNCGQIWGLKLSTFHTQVHVRLFTELYRSIFQYFRILDGVFHISTASTTKTTDFYYIFLYKQTHQAVRKGELSTIMKLVFDKADLVKSVGIAMKAVSGKTTMPILECILIDASSNVIKFTSNDMELGIETIAQV